MNTIMTISEKAINQIKLIMNNAPSDKDCIVIGIDKTGCSGYSYKIDYAMSSQLNNFEYIYNDDVKVMIDPKATMFLIGSEMDYSTDKLSSRFVFNNPNEKSTCGCGESFNI